MAGEGAGVVVAAAAGCDDDDRVTAAFVGFAVDEVDRELDCELDCELDGAAVGFVFTASPLTRKTPLLFVQQSSAVVPFPQQ